MSREEELEICARIKQARKQAGQTQEELADRLHVKQRTLQNYEHDRVPWRMLKKIAKQTGTTQEWLLHGDAKDASQLDRIEDVLVDLRAKLATTQDAVEALKAQTTKELRAIGRKLDIPAKGSRKQTGD